MNNLRIVLLLAFVIYTQAANTVSSISSTYLEGSTITLTCSFTKTLTSATYTITWIKNGDTFTDAMKKSVIDDVSNSRSTFSMARAMAGDAGTYGCSVVEVSGSTTNNIPTTAKPIYVRGIKSSSANADDSHSTATLSCAFAGDQINSITWMSPDGATITSGQNSFTVEATTYSNSVSTSVLKVGTLDKASKYGTYKCTASWTSNSMTLTQMPHLYQKESTTSFMRVQHLIIALLVIALVVVLAILGFVLYKAYKK